MADKEIKLVGSFKDDITPKLKKLSRELDVVTNGFTKMQSKLRPIARDMGVLAMASERLGASLRSQRSGFESSIRAMQQYKTVVGQVARAQRAVRPAPITPSPAAPRTPRGGGGAVPRGGGGGGGEGGIGFGALAAASFVGGAALTAATAGLQKLAYAAHGFVAAGDRFQQDTIQMAATLQTLGKVGDFQKSLNMAKQYNSQVEKVAATLPGSTQDYLQILKMTLDDQIQAYGSAEGVTKDLKKGEKSFTALFGMSAQLAGLNPAIAAMDINQLRMNPENMRQVQFLNRNPTLMKFYQEELKKTGGDFFKALETAMGKAITDEQVEALKNTFDSAYQGLVTTFTSPTGIFGAAKEVMIMLSDGTKQAMSTMDILGMFMRNLNGIVEVLLGTGIEPMQGLNQFLYEMGYYVYAFRRDLEYLKQIGTLDIQNLGRILGKGLTDMILKIVDMFLNLDFKTLLSGIDKFFIGLIEGIMEGLKTGNWGSIGVGLVKTVDAFLTTWVGKILLALAALKFAPNLTAGLVRGAAGMQGPMATAGGTKGVMAGAALRRGAAAAGQQTVGALGKAGAAVPGLAKAGGAARGALGAVAQAGKMKGVGVLAAGAVKMATVSPQLAKVGQSLAGIGKSVPLLNVAFAGLDFASRKAAGQGTAQAAGGAGGGLAGSVIGGAIGTAILPGVGTAIGAVLGNMLGGVIGEKLPGMLKGVAPALQAGWSSVSNFFTKTIPSAWNAAVTFFTSTATAAWNGLINFFKQLPSMLVSAVTAIPGLLKAGFDLYVNFWTVEVPYFIGSAIRLGIGLLKMAWTGIVAFFTTTLPSAWTAAVNFAKMALQMAWTGVVTFFTVTLPSAWTTALTLVMTTLSAAWSAVTAFFASLPGLMAAAWSALVNWARSLPATIGGAFNSFISFVSTIPGRILTSLTSIGTAIINWAAGLPGRVMASLGAGLTGGKKPTGTPRYNGQGRSMPLHQAIATEMKNKPAGSSLVIANSSETIIPAYKGYNTDRLRASSAAGGMGGGGGVSMNGITINVNGASGDVRQIADQIAGELLAAMTTSSYTELYSS